MENTNSATSKSSKESREEKQRDAKLEEQILKSIGNSLSPEEKFNVLLRKHIELEKEIKRLNATIKQHEKRHELLLREKDILQKESNKGILVRDKLEQVCREQQKLIKSVKNESMAKIREEEERRKENQAKFQESINEINVTLNKNNDENIKLKEDNIEMTKKLKYLAEQYQVREKQLEKINEQVQLESQLHEAKLAKLQMEATIEKEILLREKQAALDDLLTCKKVIQEAQKREDMLKDQLNLYTSKYDDFQSSLQKSNDIFVTYKTELEKMSKKTKKLEKESLEWKRKCEKSNASLLDLATKEQVKDEYVAKTAKQMFQLQKLLRTLQAERTTLYQVLKDNNIETPPMPVLPPEPEPNYLPPVPKQQPDKMEVIAKNCAELKQTLAKLQGQMNAITSKQSNDEKPAEEEVKKSKNKKSKNKNKSCPTKDLTANQQSKSVVVATEGKSEEVTVEQEEIKQNAPAETTVECTEEKHNSVAETETTEHSIENTMNPNVSAESNQNGTENTDQSTEIENSLNKNSIEGESIEPQIALN